jgi:hypothetical protein
VALSLELACLAELHFVPLLFDVPAPRRTAPEIRERSDD